jgi:hypothetical protein
VAGLFPPQEQQWGLDEQVHLTPKAAERVSREGVEQASFDRAAASINADWGTTYDGKQIQRWTEHYGQKIVNLQEAERQAAQQGQRPCGPENPPELLAIGMDGGRVQEREKDPETHSRWHEDKILTISSYHKQAPEKPGDDPEPQRLVTTYVGTMHASDRFGQLVRIEAERRGIRQALEVVVLGDGAAWIDTLADRHFPCHVRIIDFAHVDERLGLVAQALYPVDETKRHRLAERLESQLYEGKVACCIRWLTGQVRIHGPPRASDPEGHVRRVLAENLAYLQRHQGQMNYPEYRRKGWPIGSGVTESGVKQFNKRVKGTEQFWGPTGVESILALRALRLSQDCRWDHYWWYGRLLRQAA